MDLLLDKGRMAHPVDKKTDWFYKMNNLIEKWMIGQIKIIIEHYNIYKF